MESKYGEFYLNIKVRDHRLDLLFQLSWRGAYPSQNIFLLWVLYIIFYMFYSLFQGPQEIVVNSFKLNGVGPIDIIWPSTLKLHQQAKYTHSEKLLLILNQ